MLGLHGKGGPLACLGAGTATGATNGSATVMFSHAGLRGVTSGFVSSDLGGGGGIAFVGGAVQNRRWKWI